MNLENFHLSIEYVIVAMAGVILYLLYYVYTKDADYSRNIRSVASVVEDLNRELFYLKKQLKETESSIAKTPSRMNDEEIYQEIERSVYDMVQPLSLALKQIQSNINAIENEIETRMGELESGVKQISIPSSIHGNDDEKIISLYKQGVSVDTISKELHISKPEVEFVLKINKIK
ncbi:Putative periplasmic protein [hydrothermal vent metagenome]|uniref:Putative periplasmic protein n=1 Tax=hydrothermal vent metagenome TaxID=652676 RepID=A0A1W1CWE6_9ZZZZ